MTELAFNSLSHSHGDYGRRKKTNTSSLSVLRSHDGESGQTEAVSCSKPHSHLVLELRQEPAPKASLVDTLQRPPSRDPH